ncbi:MAG: ribose-5-phosphate isomerase RpiA [Candidatus Korarchaeum sp.]
MSDVEVEKRVAAREALELVRGVDLLGLGSGSTVAVFVEELAKSEHASRLSVIPSSRQIEGIARSFGLKVVYPDRERPEVTIDGADEVDRNLSLLKGGGGALLREKVLASNSEVYVVIVDHTKLVERLCSKRALPVEVLPYGVRWTIDNLRKELNCDAELRVIGGSPFVTDNGNFIVDLRCPPLEDPLSLEREIKRIPGVVEVGIFNDLADCVYAASGAEVRKLGRCYF